MSVKALQSLISPDFNENVVQDILRKSSGMKQVIVNNITIRDTATNKGDSYLSSIVRFTIEGSGREGHEMEKKISCPVIVKMLPKNIGRRLSFRCTDFFKNEVAFYNEIWNSLLKFQKSKNVESPFTNLPICYVAFADGINDYLVLEDLNCQSFTTFKRQEEMDYDSVMLVIRLFAKFHALSFAFKDQYPKEFQQLASSLEETYFDEKFRGWYAEFHKNLIAISRDAIQKELHPLYLQKFDEMIAKDLYGQIIHIANDVNGPFSLITQGDAWIPNFLCKYGPENRPLDIMLIDFQLARCCSPACDLSFFLYACAGHKLLDSRWNDIIAEYHSVFTSFLVELGSNSSMCTLDAFKQDFKNNALLGVGMAMEALPFQMMDDSETSDLDSIEDDKIVPITSMWKVHPIKTSEGRQKLANVFKHAVDHEFI